MGVVGEEVGVLRVLEVGDVGAVHHVLVLVGCGDVLGLMVGVEILAVPGKVIETVARSSLRKALSCYHMSLLNWKIAYGAISLISYIVNLISCIVNWLEAFFFCCGAWLEAFIVCWLDFLVFLMGVGFVVFLSLYGVAM